MPAVRIAGTSAQGLASRIFGRETTPRYTGTGSAASVRLSELRFQGQGRWLDPWLAFDKRGSPWAQEVYYEDMGVHV
jgi:hypothetical protein